MCEKIRIEKFFYFKLESVVLAMLLHTGTVLGLTFAVTFLNVNILRYLAWNIDAFDLILFGIDQIYVRNISRHASNFKSKSLWLLNSIIDDLFVLIIEGRLGQHIASL
jgi:hypothetical protein